MSIEKPYEPSPEEMAKAEEVMTEEEKEKSGEREATPKAGQESKMIEEYHRVKELLTERLKPGKWYIFDFDGFTGQERKFLSVSDNTIKVARLSSFPTIVRGTNIIGEKDQIVDVYANDIEEVYSLQSIKSIKKAERVFLGMHGASYKDKETILFSRIKDDEGKVIEGTERKDTFTGRVIDRLDK